MQRNNSCVISLDMKKIKSIYICGLWVILYGFTLVYGSFTDLFRLQLGVPGILESLLLFFTEIYNEVLFFSGLSLILGGIFVFKDKEWARLFIVRTCVFRIVWELSLGIIVYLYTFTISFDSFLYFIMNEKMLLALAKLIVYVCIPLFFLTRPKIKEQFR